MIKNLLLVLFSLQLLSCVEGKIIINEIEASNTSDLLNEESELFVDWIELYNTDSKSKNISSFYLSDNPSKLKKWRIPENTILKAESYKVFYASGLEEHGHVGFRLSSKGGKVFLSDSMGVALDSIVYGKQKTNVSYGRKDGSTSKNYFFTETTPGAKNDKIGYVNSLDSQMPTFSLKGGFYKNKQEVSIHAPEDGKTYYSIDGSEPDKQSFEYVKGQKIETDSTIVLRARTFYSSKFPSKIHSQTYFIGENITLPVVSLSINPESLYSDTFGIYVNGVNYDSAVFTSPNYYNDWTAPANFEYYDENGDQKLNMTLEYKLTGELRNYPVKSFKLTAKPKFNYDAIDYPFFEHRDRTKFNSLAFRHGGWPDLASTILRDAIIQTQSGRNYDMDYQEYQPCIVFYNGQYFGIHNIRERFTDQYFQDNNQVSRKDIDFLESRGAVIEGDNKSYNVMLNEMYHMDMNSPEAFNKIDQEIDVNQYTNYLVTEIFFANTDWPAKNIKYWKSKEGKWRWIIFDTDFGLGLRGKLNHNTFEYLYTGGKSGLNAEWSSKLFRTLMNNQEFKSIFIQKLSMYMDTFLSSEEIKKTLGIFAGDIEPQIKRHADRWSHFRGFEFWNKKVSEVVRFAEKREDHLRPYLESHYKVGTKSKLTFTSNDYNSGFIKVFGADFGEKDNTFDFYNGLSVSYEAVAKPGYVFAGWKGSKSSKVKSSHIVSNDEVIEAIFVKKQGTILPAVISENRTLTKDKSPYFGAGDVKVLKGMKLTVSEGVTIKMAEKSSIIVNGSISVKGKEKAPVLFTSENSNERWGALVLLDTDKESVIKYTRFEHSSHGPEVPRDQAAISMFNADANLDHVEITDVYGQPVFAQESKVVLTNSKIRSAITGDLVNVKRGWAKVDNCEFIGNDKVDTDAIDYDGITDGIISNNHIHGFFGFNSDGIDLGEQSKGIKVFGNEIHDCSDKGISIGQASTSELKNNVVYACEQGIGVKDSASFADIEYCTFYGNGYGIAAFEKNMAKGGGEVSIQNSIISNSYIAPFFYDNLSGLKVSYCLIDQKVKVKGKNNIISEPKFINPKISDFRLLEDSPAHNKSKKNKDLGATLTTKENVDLSDLVINELFTNSIIKKKEDWIEIYNKGENYIDLSGLYFSDDKNNLGKAIVLGSNPKQTRIAPKSYLQFICDKDSTQADHLKMKMNAVKDDLYFSKMNGKGDYIVLEHLELTKIDSISSFERINGNWKITKTPTPLLSNNQNAPIVLTEPIVVVSSNTVYNYTLIASDRDKDKLAIQAIELPSWLKLRDNGNGTAVLSGNYKTEEIAVFEIVLQISDNNGGLVKQEFCITVTP